MGNNYCTKCKLRLDYSSSVELVYILNCPKHLYDGYIKCEECNKINNCNHKFKFYIFNVIPLIC